MMPRVAVITLDRASTALPDDMAARWKDFRERLPIICVENTLF
jgi:hypothetical protein